MLSIHCSIDDLNHLVSYRDIIDTTQTDQGTLVVTACPCGGSVGIVGGHQVSHLEAAVAV